jgi:preprotein translocase subunit SecG
LFTFLLIVQTIVALALVIVILMQRSEGGGLGVGGNSAGLMTARGAADFLTRATSILAAMFVILSIALAAIAANMGGPRQIDPSLIRQTPAGSIPGQAPAGTPNLPGGPLVPQSGSAVPGSQPAVPTPVPGSATQVPGAANPVPGQGAPAPATPAAPAPKQ